jgi:hypothetical protein
MQGQTVVRCEPVSATGPETGTLTVDLFVQNVEALYGADLQLSFDTSVARVVDADAGTGGVQIQPLNEFLSPDFVLRKEADNTQGTIRYAVTQLNPREAVSGSGALARVVFQAVEAGTTIVSFTATQLAHQDGKPIPHESQSCPMTFTPIGTVTSTVTATATQTPTPMPTGSATATQTATATAVTTTPTATFTKAATATVSGTSTATVTSVASLTETATVTGTATSTGENRNDLYLPLLMRGNQ